MTPWYARGSLILTGGTLAGVLSDPALAPLRAALAAAIVAILAEFTRYLVARLRTVTVSPTPSAPSALAPCPVVDCPAYATCPHGAILAAKPPL